MNIEAGPCGDSVLGVVLPIALEDGVAVIDALSVSDPFLLTILVRTPGT